MHCHNHYCDYDEEDNDGKDDFYYLKPHYSLIQLRADFLAREVTGAIVVIIVVAIMGSYLQPVER